ncbi:unnamed protein product [Cunninghamella blakesleeana]
MKKLTVSSPSSIKFLYPNNWSNQRYYMFEMIPGRRKTSLSYYTQQGVLHYIIMAILLNTLLSLFK